MQLGVGNVTCSLSHTMGVEVGWPHTLGLLMWLKSFDLHSLTHNWAWGEDWMAAYNGNAALVISLWRKGISMGHVVRKLVELAVFC